MSERLESEKVDATKEGITKVCVILPKSLANSYLYMHGEDSMGPGKATNETLKRLEQRFQLLSITKMTEFVVSLTNYNTLAKQKINNLWEKITESLAFALCSPQCPIYN